MVIRIPISVKNIYYIMHVADTFSIYIIKNIPKYYFTSDRILCRTRWQHAFRLCVLVSYDRSFEKRRSWSIALFILSTLSVHVYVLALLRAIALRYRVCLWLNFELVL